MIAIQTNNRSEEEESYHVNDSEDKSNWIAGAWEEGSGGSGSGISRTRLNSRSEWGLWTGRSSNVQHSSKDWVLRIFNQESNLDLSSSGRVNEWKRNNDSCRGGCVSSNRREIEDCIGIILVEKSREDKFLCVCRIDEWNFCEESITNCVDGTRSDCSTGDISTDESWSS